MRSVFLCLALLLICAGLFAEPPSALYMRGYTVIPPPQTLELKNADFPIDEGWRVEPGEGVRPGDIALDILREQLSERHALTLAGRGKGKVVELAIHAGAAEIGPSAGANKAALVEQAYRLELSPERIRITANAQPGLFYGVETLVQLVKADRGRLWLPEGRIVDWPDLGLREVFWDELEHLDHLDVMKQAVRRAAFFKVNAFVLRLNQHFEYKRAGARGPLRSPASFKNSPTTACATTFR